ncbi:MAG: phosphate ABC transporter permease [Candidatus Pelagibacter sp.]|nr:phosphate ABC transporter permease [Candidatus Pelagibacter sp.]OUT93918.1 MAG: phosphate ABC transporter permease [Gammaproteobacteria bacterium TMED36]
MTITVKMLLDNFKFAFKTRKAWWYTASSRSRARFARTTLGSFWLGFSNLLSIGTLGIVYGTVFSVEDFKSYFVYLGFGLVVWNTISSSISNSPTLFAHNSSNIKNMNLKPIFYTLEEWSFQLQTFIQSFILVFFVFLFLKSTLIINLLLYSWLPLLNLIIFIYWFPLIVCLISVRFTDIAQLVPIVLQLVFLTSPILYRKESLGSLGWITNINFIYQILDPLRVSIINGTINYQNSMLLLICNFVGLFLTLRYLEIESRRLPFLL